MTATLTSEPGVGLTVLTANLGRGVGVPEFTANVRRLARRYRAVKGFQEIDEADTPDEHRILKGMLPPGWAEFARYVPIHVPAPWRIIGTRVTFACKGLAKITPPRWVTQALIERHGMQLAIVNIHFPRRTPLTVTRRRQCRKALHAVVAYWYARGVTVIWMGDTNTLREPKVHRREQRVIDARLDHLGIVPHPQGVQVEVVRTGRIDLTIDGHDAHFARLRLTMPRSQ